MKKILITGDRNWIAPLKTNENPITLRLWAARVRLVGEVIRNLELELDVALSEIIVIQGGARGVDTLARDLASQFGCGVRTYRAQWDLYGSGAGPIRNREMVDKNPDLLKCLAFHDALTTQSKGTLHMCRYAEQKGLPVIVYRSDGSSYNFSAGPQWKIRF